MNTCVRQSWKVFNNIKFYPLGGDVEGVTEDKHINAEWAEKTWKHIIMDELKRHVIHNHKGLKTDKYTTTVWDDGKYAYLINVMRTEYNTDHTSVYIIKLSDNNLSDFLAIAKFLHKNIGEITRGSVKAHKELNKLVAAMDIKNNADA